MSYHLLLVEEDNFENNDSGSNKQLINLKLELTPNHSETKRSLEPAKKIFRSSSMIPKSTPFYPKGDSSHAYHKSNDYNSKLNQIKEESKKSSISESISFVSEDSSTK